MRRSFHLALAGVALLAAACGEIGLGPAPADSAAPIDPQEQSVPAAPLPDLRAMAGRGYGEFVAGHGANYAPEALDLSAIDRTRFWRAMTTQPPGEVVRGGGTEALVFRGCAEQGCAQGEAVLAVDLNTGAAFVGVRDGGGAVELVPNARLDALLRLNSPDGRWSLQAP